MRKSFCLLPLAAALLLSGCVNLAPDYTRPEAPVAAAWPQDEATASATVLTDGLAQWGDFFTDPRMRELIRLGLMNNRDLRSATYARRAGPRAVRRESRRFVPDDCGRGRRDRQPYAALGERLGA